ncbi:MAG TPA: GDSL-type esterase/lipase family protein [Pyrinomonadaceae bacterium]|nr:GDSL-type esterase/lipase family protein [Pyrinomonadaceae bacterium]
MKVVILADSLALPREEVGGGRCFESAYPYLLYDSLKRRFGDRSPMIIERGMRLRTVEAVLTDWHEQVRLRNADVVIVQVGVVDCAPRVFLRRENRFLARRPKWIREPLLKFVHKYRRQIISSRPRVYVPLDRFRRHIEEITEKARETNLLSLIYVNIIEPPSDIEYRSPGFQKNVQLYNQVLAHQASQPRVTLIDVNRAIHEEGGAEKLTIDGVHLNVRGHEILARLLENHLASLVSLSERTILRSLNTI